MAAESGSADPPADVCMTAVMLRPIGKLSIVILTLQSTGAGFGEARSVERCLM
jgi:hypothetical protein